MQENLPPAELPLAFARIRATGATTVRINLQWAVVAPKQPANPADPGDPAYRWAKFDNRIALAVAYGLEPWLTVYTAPAWAQEDGGQAAAGSLRYPFRPSPAALGAFAHAAAIRYGGAYGRLPRVRDWEGWIEPNAAAYLMPQLENGRPASPAWYRRMLNAFADGVKSVHPDNVVVAAGLSPFGVDQPGETIVAPLRFMRELLCVSAEPAPRATCSATTRFDVWGHHPYTDGGPTHEAAGADDVSLGDLPEMRRVLDAASALGTIRSDGTPQFWVTEFSWDSSPPDTSGTAVPPGLEGRWVAEAQYVAWRAGASLFAWHQLRDLPYPASPYQGGLYYGPGASLESDSAKPALEAFRFPFVALPGTRGVEVWGRTPGSIPGSVVVEQRVNSVWRPRAVVETDGNGIFAARLSRAVRVPPLTPRNPTVPAWDETWDQTVLEDAPTAFWRPGPSGRGSAGDTVALAAAGAACTIEAWIRAGQGGGVAAVGLRDAAAGGLSLGIDSTGAARAEDAWPLVGAMPVADGRWHHLVYTRDGAIGRLYVDGLLDAEALLPPPAGSGPLVVGYDPVSGVRFQGDVDGVAVYAHPLGAARVRAHYLASGRRPVPGPIVDDPTAGPGPFLRARLLGAAEASLPFSLRAPAEPRVTAFGG